MSKTVSDALKKFFDSSAYPMIFTGAGVSAKAGLPTWGKLVERLAEGLREADPMTTQMMLDCIRTGDLTHAVDYFKLSRHLVQGDKEKMLASLLLDYDATALAGISALPFRACLTTNFDRSLFDAIAISKHQAARDYRYGDSSFRQAQWEEGLFIARIHGAVEMPSGIILSESQFEFLLRDEAYSDLLGTCFLQRNVLFLGFSFYDPAIRHVFDQLSKRFGASSPGRHMALIPHDADSDFLRKAGRLNLEVIEYDPKEHHIDLWNGVQEFNQAKTSTAPRLAPSQPIHPFDLTKKYLAACYARALSHDSSVPLREAVTEGIISAILQDASPKAVGRSELLDKIRLAIGLIGRNAEQIVDSATKSLVEAGLCRKARGAGGKGVNFSWIAETTETSTLEGAIEILCEGVKSRAYLQEGWKVGKEVIDTMNSFFGHLVRRRGWDLGAAFAASRPPEAVVIESVLAECAIGLSALDRERLIRVCTSMLQHPSTEEAHLLAELGRVSFAVELAFQSPKSALLNKAVLPRRIYFDASVLLPALVEGHPFSEIYTAAIKRLKSAAAAAAIPLQLKICRVYLNEIVSHRRNAIELSEQAGADFASVARSDALYHGVANVNVYVGAYANWLENQKNKGVDFKAFLKRFAPYTSETDLRRWLSVQGFDIVESVKGPTYPFYYSLLETAYSGPLANGKGPILIEHDAIQLALLEADFEKGERALFVTADRQLQSAVAASKKAKIPEQLISHVGLIQFIEMMLGGLGDGNGLAELLWSSRVSDRSHAVRTYFTAVGLEQYDAGLAMAMPNVIEKYTEATARELKRLGSDLESADPKRRVEAFRTLGSLEKEYLSGMQEAVEKLEQKVQGI